MIRLAPIFSLVLLAACARSEEPSMVPPDSAQGYNQVGQVRTPESDDAEPAIGQWRASLQEERAALEFGPLGTEPLLSLLCADNGAVLLQRHGGLPAGRLPAMQVQIGSAIERPEVSAGGGAIPMLRGLVRAGSGLHNALMAGPQPIQVRLDDAAPLIMPPSPLIADYVRSCVRPGGGRPGAGNSAAPAGNVAAPAADAVQPAQNAAQPTR